MAFVEVVRGGLCTQFMILDQNGEMIVLIFTILNFHDKFMYVKRRCIWGQLQILSKYYSGKFTKLCLLLKIVARICLGLEQISYNYYNNID